MSLPTPCAAPRARVPPGLGLESTMCDVYYYSDYSVVSHGRHYVRITTLHHNGVWRTVSAANGMRHSATEDAARVAHLDYCHLARTYLHAAETARAEREERDALARAHAQKSTHA